MVLGEVGRPIERADIIERDSTALDGFQSQVIQSSFDGVEDESEQPVAAVTEEDGVGDIGLTLSPSHAP